MEALTQAEELQGQAARAVGEGQTAQAIPTQGRSASALGTAAEALSRMAQRYPAAAAARNDRWALPASQSSDRAALAGAAQAADEAARTQQAAAAARAAQRLQAAYQQAEAQARQMGLAPFSPLGYVAGMAGYGLPESGRRGPIAPIPPDLLLPEAEQMEVTLDNWARLPGQLRDEILQTAGDDSPREYRALIKQYFQAIARSGSVKGSEGKP
jgi:hypothetical protein